MPEPAMLMYQRMPNSEPGIAMSGATDKDCAELSVALWAMLPSHIQREVIKTISTHYAGEGGLPAFATNLCEQVYHDRTITLNTPPAAPIFHIIPGGKPTDATAN